VEGQQGIFAKLKVDLSIAEAPDLSEAWMKIDLMPGDTALQIAELRRLLSEHAAGVEMLSDDAGFVHPGIHEGTAQIISERADAIARHCGSISTSMTNAIQDLPRFD